MAFIWQTQRRRKPVRSPQPLRHWKTALPNPSFCFPPKRRPICKATGPGRSGQAHPRTIAGTRTRHAVAPACESGIVPEPKAKTMWKGRSSLLELWHRSEAGAGRPTKAACLRGPHLGSAQRRTQCKRLTGQAAMTDRSVVARRLRDASPTSPGLLGQNVGNPVGLASRCMAARGPSTRPPAAFRPGLELMDVEWWRNGAGNGHHEHGSNNRI